MHGEELKYMKEAYDTNWMSTVGANIDAIEKIFCEMTGCCHSVALSSGTAALHMAVKIIGESIYGKGNLRGKKVACSDMTFAATVNPVMYEGMVPVFIDTEYDTWNMEPATLAKAFDKYGDIKIVVLAHLYGTPARIDEIREICDMHGAMLIEDAAESLGATYKGKQTGSFGDISCISFNGNKIITGSSGGMLLTDNEEWAAKAKKWSTQSREAAVCYQHEDVGYNYRMSNVIAGVVRGQIPYLEKHIVQKKSIYEKYREGLAGLPVKMNPLNKEAVSNYWLSCMLIDKDAMCKQTRNENEADYVSETGKSCPTEILEALQILNAEGRPIWKPMHMQPLFEACDFVSAEDGIDVGADIFKRGLCLPSDNKMGVAEVEKIIETVKECFE